MRLPVLTSAALAATLVAAAAGPATAADPEKGAGNALSAGSLVSLSVAGQTLEALRLSLPTSTGLDGSKALVSVTPLLRGSAPVVPPVEVPAGSSRELPSQTAGVPGLVELVTPTGTLSAAADPASALAQAATGVGDIRLLGTDLLGEGSLSVTSKVTELGSSGTKHLVVDDLALPTLADLLAALGLDLTKLPVGTLLDLLEVLRLVDLSILEDVRNLVDGLDLTTVTDLLDALAGDLAPAEVTALLQTATAPAELESAVAGVSSTLAGLTAQLPAAPSGISKSVVGGLPVLIGDGSTTPTTGGGTTGGGTTGGGLLGGLVGGVTTPTTGTPVVDELGGTLGQVVDQLPTGVVTELTDDINALLADPTNVDRLRDLITTLTETLEELVKDVLNTVLGGQLPAVADLPALLDTPLLSIDELDVTTIARSGADELADVTGTVTGLQVLGTDVLDTLLGDTTADLGALLGGAGLGQVQGVLDGTLASVTDVLGDAGVVLPLPEVEVLKVVEEISTVDGVRTAKAGVEALTITWGLDQIRIPAAVSNVVGGVTGGLPVALPLGGLQASALPTDQLTALLSQPMSLTIGNLVDTSAFTPGAPVAAPAPGTGTPGTGSPTAPGTPGSVIDPAPVRQLPRTGASALLAAVALAMVGGAFALRRRNEALAVDQD